MSVTRALPAGLVHRAHGNQKAEDIVQYVVYINSYILLFYTTNLQIDYMQYVLC